MNKDSAGGKEFTGQLSSFIFKKINFKSKFALLEQGVWLAQNHKECGCT